MKKTIIRLTEQDLHKMIKESAMQIIREYYDDDDYDRYERDYDYDEPDTPNFNTVVVYYNPETKECTTDESAFESGIVFECECSVSDYDIENDGIGHYEFWGHPGYDAGTDYAVPTDADVDILAVYQIDEEGEAQEIDANSVHLSEEDYNIIAEYCIENDLFEEQ